MFFFFFFNLNSNEEEEEPPPQSSSSSSRIKCLLNTMIFINLLKFCCVRTLVPLACFIVSHAHTHTHRRRLHCSTLECLVQKPTVHSSSQWSDWRHQSLVSNLHSKHATVLPSCWNTHLFCLLTFTMLKPVRDWKQTAGRNEGSTARFGLVGSVAELSGGLEPTVTAGSTWINVKDSNRQETHAAFHTFHFLPQWDRGLFFLCD